jgi:hypothetical protein
MTATRDFESSDTLVLYGEVYENVSGAPPHTIDIVSELRAEDGHAITSMSQQHTSTERKTSGGYAFTFQLGLKSLKPGLYVLHVEGRSNLGQRPTAVRQVQFRVMPAVSDASRLWRNGCRFARPPQAKAGSRPGPGRPAAVPVKHTIGLGLGCTAAFRPRLDEGAGRYDNHDQRDPVRISAPESGRVHVVQAQLDADPRDDDERPVHERRVALHQGEELAHDHAHATMPDAAGDHRRFRGHGHGHQDRSIENARLMSSTRRTVAQNAGWSRASGAPRGARRSALVTRKVRIRSVQK